MNYLPGEENFLIIVFYKVYMCIRGKKNDNNNKEEETGEEKKRIIIKDSRAPQPTTENGRSPLLTFVIGGNRVSS